MALGDPLPGCESGSSHCVTCGDEGVLMRVLRVDHVRCLAICVETGAERLGGEEIAIDLVEPVVRGQTLLVHAGVALANLEETDAALARPSARNEPPGRRAGKPHPPRSARARRAVVSSSERRA